MSLQQQGRSEESLRHEYTEAALNIRHLMNLRFTAFSIFIAIMAGVGLVAFGKGQFGEYAAMVAKIAGVLVIAIFWLHEERLTELYEHFVRMTIEVEDVLGYKQWKARPIGRGHFPNRTIIMRLFFSVLALLWLYGIFAVPLA